MPKKKKTKKQKMLSDQRKHMAEVLPTSEPVQHTKSTRKNETTPQENASSAPSYSLKNHEQMIPRAKSQSTKPTTTTITTHAYNYLGRDLWKTALLTGSIVIAELVIHFFANS